MPSDIDPLERIENLILFLSTTPRNKARSLEEIRQEIPGFEGAHDAVRQKFERDKKLLRQMGIEVKAEAIDGPAQMGYWIDPNELYLPDLSLSAGEQAALALAVATVAAGDSSGNDGLLKLAVGPRAPQAAVNAIDTDVNLAPLFEAMQSKAAVSFRHADQDREVTPTGLRFHAGHWYLSAYSPSHGEIRNFRLDRIEGQVEVAAPSSGEIPEEFQSTSTAVVTPFVDAADGEAEGLDLAKILVNADLARRFRYEVGSAAEILDHPDGSLTATLPYASSLLFRTWIFSYLDHVVVEGPEALRSEIIDWLESLDDSLEPKMQGLSLAKQDVAFSMAMPEDAAPARKKRIDQRARLQRLLAILGFIAQHEVVEIAELAERFGMDEAEVIEELEQAACYGVPPYDPGCLLDIIVHDGQVTARLPEQMAQPRRLTTGEAVAVLTASKGLLAIKGGEGNTELQSAVSKLERALDASGRLEVNLPAPELLPAIEQALAQGHRLAISYYVSSRDEITERVIDPLQIKTSAGLYYVRAWCHEVDAERNFRIDNIESLEDLGAQQDHATLLEVEVDADLLPLGSYDEVIVAVDHAGSWIADSVPSLAVEWSADGGALVTLAVAGKAWLERILLSLGAHGRVLGPDEYLETGPKAAARVLARYR